MAFLSDSAVKVLIAVENFYGEVDYVVGQVGNLEWGLRNECRLTLQGIHN